VTRGPSAPARRTIGRQAMWNYLVFALSKAMTLIMTVALARLLGPEDFGLFALALVVMTMFDFVRDLGVAAALVQRPEPWSRLAPTGLTLSLVAGAVMGAGAFLVAPAAAGVLGEPALAPLIQVLAIGLTISALGVLPSSALRREIDFRRRLWPEFSGAVVKAGVAIALAVAGTGVWSLVWAQLAASTVTTCAYWIVARPRVRFGFDGATAVSLLRFGLPLSAVGLMSFAVYNVDYTAIGRRLGAEELGYYTLAYRLPELAVLAFCVVVGDVLFSTLSRLQDDREQLVARYLGTLRGVVAVTSFIGFMLSALAADVVGLLYGPRFAPAIDELAAISVFTVLYTVSFHAGDVYKAMGRPVLLTALGAVKLAVLAPVVWIAAGHSTLAVALGLVAVEVVVGTIRLGLVHRVLGVSIARHVRVLAGPVAASAAAAGTVWGLSLLLPSWPSAARLAVLLPLAVLAQAGALRICAPRLWRAGLAAARGIVRPAAGRPRQEVR
jgi:lipopolysaccharide exporter